MILVYFNSGGCVDDVVNNRTNHQFTSVIVVHFMNSARASEELFLMSTSVKTSVRDMKTINLKGVIKNQDIKGSFFQKGYESRFLLEFSKNFYLEHLLGNDFFDKHLICFARFPKECSSTFCNCRGLTKLLMQTSTVKIKSCSFSNNEFHCLLGRLFPRF